VLHLELCPHCLFDCSEVSLVRAAVSMVKNRKMKIRMERLEAGREKSKGKKNVANCKRVKD